MEKGVLLIAFGKPGYAYMAYNMALSIRATSPDVKIAIAHDGVMNYAKAGWAKLIDHEIILTEDQLNYNGKKEPGWTKLQAYDLSPFEKTLFLDVDGCVLQDISPLLDIDKDVASQVHGEGGLEDDINYAIWAEKAQTWAWFDIPLDGKFQASQTSLVYFRKSKTAEQFYKAAKEKFNFPLRWRNHSWGGAMPDELIFSGTAANMGLDIKTPEKYVFFGWKVFSETKAHIRKKNYVLSLYGGRTSVKKTYGMWYDNLIEEYGKSLRLNPNQIYNRHDFISQKHANAKK